MQRPKSTTTDRSQQPTPYDITLTKPDGSIELFFRPTPKQADVLPILLSGRYPNVFIYGNRGGGKSHMARHFAHVMALKHPGFKYAILRTSYPELQKIHLNFLPAEMDKKNAHPIVCRRSLAATRHNGQQGASNGRQGGQERQGKNQATAREETETRGTTEAGQGPAKDSVAAGSSRRKPEGEDMKVVVDLSICDLHGLCVEAAPEVFQIGDDGALHVLIETPPDGLRAKVDKAVRECPTGAISIEE